MTLKTRREQGRTGFATSLNNITARSFLKASLANVSVFTLSQENF